MGKSAINPAVVGKHSTDIAALKNDLGIVEDGDTATHTIAQGQYVIWQGALYTADAAIASGTTLAESGGNKNLTAVENGGLNALNSNIEMLGSNLLNSNQTYQLPNDWKIAIIEVYVGGSAVTFTTIVVNNGRTKSVRFGNYEVGATSASTNASGAQVEITSSNIVSLIGVYWVGTNRLSDSVYSVKYFRMK